MKKIIIFLSVYFFGILLSGAIAQDVLEGRFIAKYSLPKNFQYLDYYKVLKNSFLLDQMASSMNDFISLPDSIKIKSDECGFTNAFYMSNSKTITFCYELIHEIYEQAGSIYKEKDQSGEYFGGVIAFIMLHEIGHALVDVLDLPIVGKEEDAVDQFALVALLNMANSAENSDLATSAVINSSIFFKRASNLDFSEEHFAGEHSLNQQRFYNLICWMYGSDPDGYSQLVSEEILPESRSGRCEKEYKKISSSWQKMLAPYSHIEGN